MKKLTKRKQGQWFRPGNKGLYAASSHAQRREAKLSTSQALREANAAPGATQEV